MSEQPDSPFASAGPITLPAPAIVGPITAEDAIYLGNINPEAIEGDARVLEIRQQLGDVVANEGGAFALVMGEDEQGQPQPSHNINIGEDIGTTIQPRNHEAHGLPEPTEAFARLEQERAEREANTKEEAPQVTVSEEREAFSGQLNTEEILNDTNLLLQPDNLRQVADIVAMNDRRNEAVEAKDINRAHEIDEIERVARMNILGPEQAAQAARTMTREYAVTNESEVRAMAQRYEYLANAVPNRGLEYQEAQSQLPVVRSHLLELRNRLQNQQELDRYDAELAQRIQDFGSQFQAAYHTDTQASDVLLQQARVAVAPIDELMTSASRSRYRLTQEVEDRLQMVDEAELQSTTVPQVIKRGESSIAAHGESCEQEYTAGEQQLNAARMSISGVEEKTQMIFNLLMNPDFEAIDNADVHNLLGHTGNLYHYVTTVVYSQDNGNGRHYIEMALDAIGRVEERLTHFEERMEVHSKIKQYTAEQVALIAKDAASITQLPIFESNR